MNDLAELIERLETHMGKQDVAVSLSDCRKAAEALRKLREALTNCRRLSGLDDDLVAGTSAVVMQRMAEIHQHSAAALAQPKEGQEDAQ